MGTPKKTSNHEALAKIVANSVKSKPARAVSIIEMALNQKIKMFPADSDKDMKKHVEIIGECIGIDTSHSDFATALAKVKAPKVPYKKVKGKYGVVASDLVRQLCEAEPNVTEDKIKDACDTAAGKKGQSGVKVLSDHKKYTAELKITGASKRLYATADKSGATYTFKEMGKHT